MKTLTEELKELQNYSDNLSDDGDYREHAKFWEALNLAQELHAQNARYWKLLGECGEALMNAHPKIDGLSDRQRVGVLICKLQKEGVV